MLQPIIAKKVATAIPSQNLSIAIFSFTLSILLTEKLYHKISQFYSKITMIFIIGGYKLSSTCNQVVACKGGDPLNPLRKNQLKSNRFFDFFFLAKLRYEFLNRIHYS